MKQLSKHERAMLEILRSNMPRAKSALTFVRSGRESGQAAYAALMKEIRAAKLYSTKTNATTVRDCMLRAGEKLEVT
jgi:hypothetical protein